MPSKLAYFFAGALVALISSFTGRPLPKDSVVFGEIALSGDVRPAPRLDQDREALLREFGA